MATRLGHVPGECPHPARDGSHEEYLCGDGTAICRACGMSSDGRGPGRRKCCGTFSWEDCKDTCISIRMRNRTIVRCSSRDDWSGFRCDLEEDHEGKHQADRENCSVTWPLVAEFRSVSCDRCPRPRARGCGVLCAECKELTDLRAWRKLVCGNLEVMKKDKEARKYHGHFSSILASTDWHADE